MTIKLTAKNCTINGHEFDPKADHKTVVALMLNQLMKQKEV